LQKSGLKGPEEYQAAAKDEEAEVDIVPPFIAYPQSALSAEPPQAPLYHFTLGMASSRGDSS
jgi:hypothetical protein